MKFWLWIKLLFMNPQDPAGIAQDINVQDLCKLAPQASPQLLAAVQESDALYEKYGLKGEKFAFFLAQILVESAYFTRLEENLNYSATRLLQVFPKRFTLLEAQACAHNPQRIANRVYALRLGNGDEASNDGWQFRGRGFIQLTGRANYKRIGQAMGVDIENNPDLLLNPKLALHCACAYWDVNKINRATNIKDVTRHINPALMGLKEREAAFEEFKKIIIF